MGICAVASLSLYSFPSLNDTPSREIEFFTSLNTIGPQGHWKRSWVLKHVSSPGYKIKTSFLKGCSRPSETRSRDGAYKKAVCVLCGGIVFLLAGLLWRPLFWRDLFPSSGQLQEGTKGLSWKVCGWRLLLFTLPCHCFYVYTTIFSSFSFRCFFSPASFSSLRFCNWSHKQLFIFLCGPTW